MSRSDRLAPLTCGNAERKSVLSKLTCISHLTADFAPGPVAAGVDAYNALIPAGITARSHAHVTALFSGLPLVPPGVCRSPSGGLPMPPVRGVSADMYAGLAAVTGRSR